MMKRLSDFQTQMSNTGDRAVDNRADDISDIVIGRKEFKE